MSKRYDWAKIGLVKKLHVTTFEGKGIEDFDEVVKIGLANEAFFTKLTRACAGHENDTDAEKKVIVKGVYDMLLSGKLTTGKKAGFVKVDPFTDACNRIWASDEKEKVKLATIKALETAYGKTFDPPEEVEEDES
jgi:hypothetical protein